MKRTRAALALLLVLVSCKESSRPAETARVDAAVAAAPKPSSPIPADWPHRADAPAVTGAKAMVASDSPEAAEIGAQVLRDGGNAADAAVATLFALAVAYPEAGSLGGGGFAVVVGPDGKAAALDFREMAPGKASREMYVKAAPDASVTGALSAGVPGVVMGAWELHEKYGSKPWADLIAPSVRLAREGFPVTADMLTRLKPEEARLARYPGSAAIYLPGGTLIAEGAILKNPDLAASLERIAKDGPKGFYAGKTAELIVAEMKRSGGIMTARDLAAYKAVWRDPASTEYRGHRIYSMPPPSSGGMAIVMLANLMAGFPKAAWHSPEHLHQLAEAMRRVFADRNALLGDPDFVQIERDLLLSAQYADERRKSIDPARATPSKDISAGVKVVAGGTDTTHFSVVDERGMAVALTTTINLNYGSAVTVTGAGFLLNDEMDDFTTLKPGGNAFGLQQGERNVVAPGKRPLSSMSPTVVVGPDGRVKLVTGARGGGRIITVAFQILANVVDYDMDVVAAVAAPRIHHQHLPDKLFHEKGGLTDEQRKALEQLGHVLSEQPPGQTAPTILRKGDGWVGTPDPRRQGKAVGI